jgi:hypothetical protein
MTILIANTSHEGFLAQWCDWTTNFMQGGSAKIRVNYNIGHYFETRKGRDKVIDDPQV